MDPATLAAILSIISSIGGGKGQQTPITPADTQSTFTPLDKSPFTTVSERIPRDVQAQRPSVSAPLASRPEDVGLSDPLPPASTALSQPTANTQAPQGTNFGQLGLDVLKNLPPGLLQGRQPTNISPANISSTFSPLATQNPFLLAAQLRAARRRR